MGAATDHDVFEPTSLNQTPDLPLRDPATCGEFLGRLYAVSEIGVVRFHVPSQSGVRVEQIKVAILN
jgi:hypothetical protein